MTKYNSKGRWPPKLGCSPREYGGFSAKKSDTHKKVSKYVFEKQWNINKQHLDCKPQKCKWYELTSITNRVMANLLLTINPSFVTFRSQFVWEFESVPGHRKPPLFCRFQQISLSTFLPSKSGNSQMYHPGLSENKVYPHMAVSIGKMNERDDEPVDLKTQEYPFSVQPTNDTSETLGPVPVCQRACPPFGPGASKELCQCHQKVCFTTWERKQTKEQTKAKTNKYAT